MKKEYKYQFKKDLLQIHKKNIRDLSLVPEENEFELKNGLLLVVAEDAGIVTMTAVRDFQEYLLTSMRVSAAISYEGQENCILISLNSEIEEASGYMGYRITVEDKKVVLEGFDEKGIAQGLYFLEDLMNIRKAPFLKKEVIKRKAVFEMRTTHSPFGMFEWPDEALAMVAHRGMDTIDLWIKDGFTTQRQDFIDLRLLSERAAKYGIGLGISLSAPHNKHPEDPGAQEFYDELYGSLFRACPGIMKVTLVGESTNFVSKDPKAGKAPYSNNFEENIPTGKWSPGWWPCNDYPQWVEMIKNSIRKYSSDCKIVFSTYNWGFAPEEDRVRLINALPDDIIVNATWDMFHQYRVGNSVEDVVDYTLSFAGPGEYFTSEAIACKKRGLKLTTNAQSGGRTWDFGVVPYEPMPGQWIKRYEGMLKAHEDWGLCGVTENIHYGFYPSFIGDLEKWAFFTNCKPLEEVLKDLLIRDYEENADAVLAATKKFDEAILHYVPTNEDQYGGYRIGPAYPFWLEHTHALPGSLPEEGKRPRQNKAMFGNDIYFSTYVPDVAGRNSLTGVRIYDELESTGKMRDLILEGIRILESCPDPNENLEKLLNLSRFIYRTILTVIHVKEHYILKQKLSVAQTRANAEELLNKVEELLLEEKENALQSIPLVQADSRLGWEPSMEYAADEDAILWKIRQIDYELEIVLPKFRKGNNLIEKF